jgi:hypothetical protein
MDENYTLWAIVKVAGGQYIGRLQPPLQMGTFEDNVINTVQKTGCIFMKPALEFNMLMQQTREGVSRAPLTVGVGACLREMGAYLWPSSIAFFSHMDKRDLEEHKKIVAAAMQAIMEARAAEAGLVFPGNKEDGGPRRFG